MENTGKLPIWWRARKYGVGERSIRAAGSKPPAPYAPWRVHRELEGAQVAEPAYLGLANVVLTATREEGVSPGSEAEAQLLAWVAANGLLGIVPQECSEITKYPPAADGSPDGWVLISHTDDWWALGGIAGDVEQEEWPKSWVRRWRIGSTEPVRESGEWLIRFFPNAKEDWKSYDYPRPLSEEFWQEYAEPVDEFLRVAQQFASVVVAAGGVEDSVVAEPSEPLSQADGLERLGLYLDRVALSFELDRSKDVHRHHKFPSLLSMLAMMAAEDLEAGFRVRNCKQCGKFFRYRHGQSMYCSDRCRWVGQKRAQKARTKSKAKRKRARRSS